MTYLVITIFLIIAIIGFTIYPRFSVLSIKHTHAVSFTITITATFIGVFLAIYIDKIETSKTEKNQTEKLLIASGYEINEILLDIPSQIQIAESHSAEMTSFLLHFELPYPELYCSLLKSEFLIRNISVHTFIEMNINNLDKLQNLKTGRENTITDLEGLKSLVNIYYLQIQHSLGLLELEIEYINGNLCEDSLYKKQIELNNNNTLQLGEEFIKRKPYGHKY